MGKKARQASSNGSGKSSHLKRPLPNDPQVLGAMLDAVNDLIERVRTGFTNDPRNTCLALVDLLENVEGKSSPLQSSTPLRVKPAIFVAVQFLELGVIRARFQDLASAMKAARPSAIEPEERAPLYLDPQDEIAYYEQQSARKSDSLFQQQVACSEELAAILIALRNDLANQLSAQSNSSPVETSTRRKSKWDDLVSLHHQMKAERPDVTNSDIVARYNQKYSRREQATSKVLADALYYRRSQ